MCGGIFFLVSYSKAAVHFTREGLNLGWGQGPTPSTTFDDRMGSSPPPGVEPGSMTIGPQGLYQTSYHIPSCGGIFFLVSYSKIHIFRPNISLILHRTTNLRCTTHNLQITKQNMYVEENKSVDSPGINFNLDKEG
ncbi:hypothetical protein YC2023_016888 [Brassica napus]